jgi:hypothetical protein
MLSAAECLAMRTGNPGGGQGRLMIFFGATSLIGLVLLFDIQALTIGKSPQLVKPRATIFSRQASAIVSDWSWRERELIFY